MRFRKKPIVIEAIQFMGRNGQEIQCLYDLNNITPTCWGTLLIKTLEGTMEANEGDWIIRGIRGEVYPCKREIFEATYEAVE